MGKSNQGRESAERPPFTQTKGFMVAQWIVFGAILACLGIWLHPQSDFMAVTQKVIVAIGSAMIAIGIFVSKK